MPRLFEWVYSEITSYITIDLWQAFRANTKIVRLFIWLHLESHMVSLSIPTISVLNDIPHIKPYLELDDM